MGGVLKCCCDGCCGALLVPSGWTLISECCAQKITYFANDWTVACTDPVRTDTRSASVDYLLYRGFAKHLYVNDLFFDCHTLPSGTIECTVDGEPMPDCDLDDELCNTVTEYHEIITTSKLVIRYKLTAQVDTLTRVQTSCDGGASACVWLLVSKQIGTVQHRQIDFIDDTHTVTDTSSDTCCGDYSSDVTTTAQTCEEAAATLTGGTDYTFSRSRYFTSAPSGTYSLDEGDTANCTPLSGSCTDVTDGDEVEICAVDPGAIDWTPPACVSTETIGKCYFVLHYIDIDYPGFWFCSWTENPGATSIFHGIDITGDLLSGLDPGVISPAYPDCYYTCPDVHPSHDPILILNYAITRIECSGLTSSQSDTGFTSRCITLSYPGPWSVTI